METKRAKVINPECLLYGEVVEVTERVVYIDDDCEEYTKDDLEFLD